MSNVPRRTLTVAMSIVAIMLALSGAAYAQEETPPAPTVVDCSPFSILCGLQIGPFYLDVLEGGSVFPPAQP